VQAELRQFEAAAQEYKDKYGQLLGEFQAAKNLIATLQNFELTSQDTILKDFKALTVERDTIAEEYEKSISRVRFMHHLLINLTNNLIFSARGT